jgi:N-acetylglucosamine-6-phosphate deacetylase
VDAATRLPADLVGRPDLGRIAPGAAADLLWLGDDLSTRATWVSGDLAYGTVPAASANSLVDGVVDGQAPRLRAGPVRP